jgi:hypothetical protein
MAKNKTVIYFTVQAYNEKKDNLLVDSCQIQLVDTTEKNALARAEKLIKKENYRVSAIVEEIVK